MRDVITYSTTYGTSDSWYRGVVDIRDLITERVLHQWPIYVPERVLREDVNPQLAMIIRYSNALDRIRQMYMSTTRGLVKAS